MHQFSTGDHLVWFVTKPSQADVPRALCLTAPFLDSHGLRDFETMSVKNVVSNTDTLCNMYIIRR